VDGEKSSCKKTTIKCCAYTQDTSLLLKDRNSDIDSRQKERNFQINNGVIGQTVIHKLNRDVRKYQLIPVTL